MARHELDRIDREDGRLDGARLLENACDVRVGEQVEVPVTLGIGWAVDALGAQLDLVRAFLAAGVEHGRAERRDVTECLQQERALADAGITTQQDGAAGNAATAEHAIQFADAGGESRRLERFDLPQWHRGRGRSEALPCRCRAIGSRC